MLELNVRAEQFLASIRAEGERQCAEIREKTDAEVEAALSEAQKTEAARAESTVAFETARAKTQANRALSAARTEARGALAKRRAELADAVFAKAQQKLADFTRTDDYGPWLRASAAALAKRLGEGTVLYARSADLPLLTDLPAGCTAQADAANTLGGLRAENPSASLAADDTLAARLAAQRPWFLENAGLEIAL